jgi:DNA processing protein
MNRAPLSDAERVAWLRLARTQNVGPATFAALVARFKTAARAIAEVPNLARRGGNTQKLVVPSAADAQREIDALAKIGGRILASGDPEFPPGLAALDPPPPVLSIIGRAELFEQDIVAIVGARNASALGRRFAAQLAVDLGRARFVVASGLARGIDAAAHEAALESGTCAVVAGGIDVVYPPEHAKLYERIKERGIVVAEMPLGQSPLARHFPRRNRIISGLSRGVVVVEAAEGSGSLITANYALEQGREVFAVPGSPLDPRARGTNRLIRDGATLTESAEDVIGALAGSPAGFREPKSIAAPESDVLFPDDGDSAHIRKVLEELLGPAPVDIDELVRQSGAPVTFVLAVLLELELAGKAVRHPGGKISRS